MLRHEQNRVSKSLTSYLATASETPSETIELQVTTWSFFFDYWIELKETTKLWCNRYFMVKAGIHKINDSYNVKREWCCAIECPIKKVEVFFHITHHVSNVPMPLLSCVWNEHGGGCVCDDRFALSFAGGTNTYVESCVDRWDFHRYDSK